jgi:hypothetical protein
MNVLKPFTETGGLILGKCYVNVICMPFVMYNTFKALKSASSTKTLFLNVSSAL